MHGENSFRSPGAGIEREPDRVCDRNGPWFAASCFVTDPGSTGIQTEILPSNHFDLEEWRGRCLVPFSLSYTSESIRCCFTSSRDGGGHGAEND